jgi:hypothetical protein
MPLGRADLFFNQIKVVEQPFPRRGDTAAGFSSFAKQAVDSEQDSLIVRQTPEKRVDGPVCT